MKSDLFNILLNNINVGIGGVSETKLAGMFGTTTSKIDVLLKNGFIKHDGNKIDPNSVNDFLVNLKYLIALEGLRKLTLKSW